MKNLLSFLTEVGTLKEKERRGWTIHGIKNAETTAEHIFTTVFLVWLLGRKKEGFDMEKAMKIALIHDICEVYSPDFTSYDAAAIKEEGEITREEVENLKPQKGRPTTKQRKKLQKIKKEMEDESMEKLVADLDDDLKKEIYTLWEEYEEGSTSEGRFVKQADKVINLFQGIEYYKKHGKIEHDLWVRRAKETIDDPHLLGFIGEIEESLEE